MGVEVRPVDGNDQTAMDEDRADGEAMLLIEVRGVDSALEVGDAPPEDRRQRPVRKSQSRRSDLQETQNKPSELRGSEAGGDLEHN